MKKFLEDLYRGKINPLESQTIPSPALQESMYTVATNEEKLLTLLSGTEKDLFRKFSSAFGKVDSISSMENFIYGFRLGAQCMLAILEEPLPSPSGEKWFS